MGPEGRPQRGLRPAGVAPDGTSAAVRRVLHPEKHGTGTQLPDQHAQVPRSGSVLPPYCPAAWSLHALLLLHSRRSPGPDAAVRGVLPAVPHHLLSQRPSLHRARTPPPRPPLSQRRQCVPRHGGPDDLASRGGSPQSDDHSSALGALDLDGRPEVLHHRSRGDQPPPALLPPAGRVLPKPDLSAPPADP